VAGEAVKFGLMQRFTAGAPEKKIFGVTVCTVINNIDCNGQARVQLNLPWLPGFQPWARISNQSAGSSSGSYFVPQVGEEVLVSFNHGDVREPYIVGALWNTQDRPPAEAPTDAVTKRKIRTPKGHELEFDDMLQKVTLTTSAKTTITLDSQKAEISTPSATVTLAVAGDVSISGKTKITLNAPNIEINGTAAVTIDGKAVQLKASALCEVKGQPVKIN
jgi:phage baseplate assembly protein V